MEGRRRWLRRRGKRRSQTRGGKLKNSQPPTPPYGSPKLDKAAFLPHTHTHIHTPSCSCTSIEPTVSCTYPELHVSLLMPRFPPCYLPISQLRLLITQFWTLTRIPVSTRSSPATIRMLTRNPTAEHFLIDASSIFGSEWQLHDRPCCPPCLGSRGAATRREWLNRIEGREERQTSRWHHRY